MIEPATRSVRHITIISNAAEHYEASGFVMDVILADGSFDDQYGDSAHIHPVEIARDDKGIITAVLCEIRIPKELPGTPPEAITDRILVTA